MVDLLEFARAGTGDFLGLVLRRRYVTGKTRSRADTFRYNCWTISEIWRSGSFRENFKFVDDSKFYEDAMGNLFVSTVGHA